ncbi:UNVERIFIED_CONTAM: Major vault protein [Trichonephila clavipes]
MVLAFWGDSRHQEALYLYKYICRVIHGPQDMIIIPPYHYCIIRNPVLRNSESAVVYDSVGQIKLKHADLEVRLQQDPFPLYPGEVIHVGVTPLTVVPSNTALRLKAVRDFEDDTIKRIAGDEWLFEGPGMLFTFY